MRERQHRSRGDVMRAWVFFGAFGLLGAGACVGDTIDGGQDSAISDSAPSDVSTVDDVVSEASTDASDAAPTYDVKSISGLSLWLEASTGVTVVTGGVTVWADQSTNGNDAKVGASEPTPPTLVASSIHGMPAVHFENGAHVEMLDGSSLQLGVGDFSFTVVMQNTTSNVNLNYGLVFAKQAYSAGFPGIAVFQDFPKQTSAFFGQAESTQTVTSTTTGLDNGTPHVFGFRRVGATLSIRIDGAIDSVSTPDSGVTDLTASGIPARIGAGGEGTNAIQIFTGDIAEVVLVKGAISDAGLVALETYLKGRYGL